MTPHDAGARPPVAPGQDVTCKVTDLAFGGSGVAHIEGYAVFVRGGLPGQTVRARILKRKPGYAEARVEEILVHSPEEVAPRCVHFGLCGGCLWQNLQYDRQLAAKAAQVRECLVRIGGLSDPPVQEALAAAELFGYRNKMEFSFADHVWRGGAPDAEPAEADVPPFGCGLHLRGRFDTVLNLTECHLMAPWAAAVLATVRRAARATGLPAYATRFHGGFYRFLVLREGTNTGERMLNLITYPPAGAREENAIATVLEAVQRAHPEVTSLIHGVTASRASVAFCESHRAWSGPPLIRERLLEDTFEIGPNTFFQTNTHQAERLFRLALEMAGEGIGVAYDLYCGVGALTLPLSHRAATVVGVELVEDSVAAARRNATLSGRNNITFLAADIRRALTPEGVRNAGGELVAGRPDLVVVDPPRDGLHPDVVRGLVALAPPRLVYVSCNPATLARDAALLVAGGYQLERAVPVDMFPHTAHVEVVAALALQRGPQ